jgi:hypothetical protein
LPTLADPDFFCAAGKHMQIADGLKPPEFLLNGRAVPIEGISTRSTLLDVQRARGLTRAKDGCAWGECAIAAFGDGGPVDLAIPATPERVFSAIRRWRANRETPAPEMTGAAPR